MSDTTLQTLENSLANQSYVSGFVPTSADKETYEKLKSEPDHTKYPNAFRWYRHISAFTPSQRSSWARPDGSKVTATTTTTTTTTNTGNESSESGEKKVSKKELRAQAGASQQQQPKQQKSSTPAAPKQQKAGNRDGLEHTREEDFGKWYEDLVKKSGLIEYYDISGCYILRPWAYSIWETIQKFFDQKIKAIGVQNAYFPLFVSKKNLCAEEDHIEDFAPEVAWVTRAGQSELETPIAVRATSETIMYPVFGDWIQSHRDLPLQLNQWCSVVRWEFKNPTPFIRSREFLWQEGHTCHATQEEADKEVLEILDFYRAVYEELLAVPVVKGRKSEKEKFAGASYTTTVEGFIPGVGRGVQGATSHCLGQNFSHIFDITFLNNKLEKQYVIQNSWGLTTRSIGVAIMVHSDDKGLVLPPRVAPLQVVIVPIPKKDVDTETLLVACRKIYESVKSKNVIVKLDDAMEHSPGWKYNHWELKGVPIRVELGARDLENKQCVLVRRDTGEKISASLNNIEETISNLLETIQSDMFKTAKAKLDQSITQVFEWKNFVPTLNEKKLCLTPWCGTKESEEQVKLKSAEESKKLADGTGHTAAAKTLCIPFEQPPLPANAKCFITGQPAVCWALWGRSY